MSTVPCWPVSPCLILVPEIAPGFLATAPQLAGDHQQEQAQRQGDAYGECFGHDLWRFVVGQGVQGA